MDVNVPRGKYNSKILQVEPTVFWATSTEIAISIWTYKNIKVLPSFKSFGTKNNSIKEQNLPEQNIEANSPTIIKFGCLIDLKDNYLKESLQTKTILKVKCIDKQIPIDIFELHYNILSSWSGGSFNPNVPDLSILISSCWRLPGDINSVENFPYSLYKIFSKYTYDNDLNIVLGDNVYLSEYLYNSESGLIERYKKLHNFPELKGSWSNIPWSAIPDDHDLGINDETNGSSGFYLMRKIFGKMWPNNSFNPISPLIWSMTRHDICIIGLDDISFKTDLGSFNPSILGEKQINWLRQSLYSAKMKYENPFILICVGTPFISPNEGYFFYYEQKRIENIIVELKLKNVFFLTGDSHLSDISVKNIGNNITIHEIRCSPMSSHPAISANLPNPYRIPGSLIDDFNFGRIFFSGKFGSRKLEYTNILQDGSIPFKFSYLQKK